MAQFQYTAVSQAGKKLSGIIGAATEEDARKQLNTFGISVLGIERSAETGQLIESSTQVLSQELQKFEFEAYDKNGQKVLGTIPGANRYTAFKRLMEEYEFEVAYVVPLGATPEQKEQAKQEDLSALKAQYEEQEANETPTSATQESSSNTNASFKRRHQELIQKVDVILEKIRTILQQYQNEIKPENREIIQSYIDKLLRIKSSTNLDYIEHTSEELLKHVQDQELFLHKEQMSQQRAQIQMTSKTLMAELHARPDDEGVMDDLQELQSKWTGSESRLLQGIAQFLKNIIPSKEEKELKSALKNIKRQIFSLWKLWLTAPKNAKTEVIRSLKHLREQRAKAKAKLKAYKNTPTAEGQPTTEAQPLITEEITHFLGWLLGFYLLAYFASYYLASKDLSQFHLPGHFNLLGSGVLRGMLISTFLWYGLLHLRLEYLRYEKWATALIVPVGILLNAFFLFNL